MILQDYTVIDLEMTGLHPKNDAILEVGAAKIRNGEVTDTMDIFVNPGRKITQEITELTGITDEMVKEGLSPAAAFHKTAEFIGDDILVGHNIIFDYSFLKQQAVNEKVPFEKKAVDTLKAARKCMLRPGKKSLECLCDYLDIEREREHRAIYDALATHELYQYLQKTYGETNPEVFEPKDLIYKTKRQTPATKIQKIHLKELADYHKIELDIVWEQLTRSEASRLMDKLISQYGRCPKD